MSCRIGVFGLKRGLAYINAFQNIDGMTVSSICDANHTEFEKIKHSCPSDVKYYEDFEDFIDSGLDAVVLSNYFHEHSKYAILALNKGIHVLSETTAAPTLGECVKLCETVEQTGMKYMLAANVPYMNGCYELSKLYKEGSFGRIYYAESEYFHPATAQESAGLAPDVYHWRRWLPRTYYNMHTLGPLMFITDTMPKKVNAKAIHSPEYAAATDRANGDIAAIMLYEMDNGAIFRTTGSVSLGPIGKWFRLSCANGTIETVRGNQDAIKYDYTPWLAPKGEEISKIYVAAPVIANKEALKSGHGGSDYTLCMQFADYLLRGVYPFFDVYRSVALSAAGIIAWKSVLNNGDGYDIENFRDRDARIKYADDFMTPFPGAQGDGATIQCSSKPLYNK